MVCCAEDIHTFHDSTRFPEQRLVRLNLGGSLGPHENKVSILNHRGIACKCLILGPYPAPCLVLTFSFRHMSNASLNGHDDLFIALSTLHSYVADRFDTHGAPTVE
jgi:hypothetical protein